MEKFWLQGHHLDPNASFGMDELCNFEAHKMYASIDISNGGTERANQKGENLSVIEEIQGVDCAIMASDGDIVRGDLENADAKSMTSSKSPLAMCNTMMRDCEDEISNTKMLDCNNIDIKAVTPIKSPLAISNTETLDCNNTNIKAITLSGSPLAISNNEAIVCDNADINIVKPSRSPLPSRRSRLSVSSSSSSKRIRLEQSSQSPASSSTTIHSGSTLIEHDTEDCESDVSLHGPTLVDGRQFEAPLPESLVLCINAGGASISDTSFGADFSEDSHFIGGDVLGTGEAIANTNDPLIYQTARYGNFSYFIENLPPGDYVVDLHFAEIIFTNGPPGLRVFDVLVQNQKVVAKLDVYSIVGSNTPLVIKNVRATVKDKGLLLSFCAIAGSPSINAICIRKPLSQEAEQHAAIHSIMVLDAQTFTKDQGHFVQKADLVVRELLQPQVQQQQIKKQKSKTKKRVQEYELKIQELKNEVHQAWMSVQDVNRQNEKLQNELDCRSFHVDSLAQAVERQLFDMNDVKDKAKREKQEWISTLLQINAKFELLQKDYNILAREAHEWVSSFPAIQSMTEKVQALVDELEELKKKFIKQGQDLRLYYNQVLELKGNIRVFCRCRPLSTTEMSVGASSIVDFDSTRDNELVVRSNGTKKTFKFDRVFTPSSSQSDVFLDTAPVVVSVLDGYNVCIFAYGQTGTGKTFTMEGTENDRGVNYRTLEKLFELAAKRKGQYEYIISVSVVEVYNEQIRDLLAQPGQCAKKLEIKQIAEGVHYVPGLTEATVQCMEEVWDVLQTGSSARAVGSTNANEHSSRSHCMLCVMVKGENLLTGESTRSKLWLVDLAGSERVAKTDVQGERLKEAQNINKSLSALGDVIHALATKSSHVPYRNSKLTHLLQDSLGGESKTLMFVQISPTDLDGGETLCSLNFASRVRGIELGPARKQLESSETVKYKQMIERFKQDARVKEETLRKQEDSIKKLEDNLKTKEQAFRANSDKVKDHEGTIAVEKRARSTAECKLKEQQSLIEKLRDDLKAKSTADCRLKEHQSLIEKLREELKARSSAENKLKEQQSLIEKFQEESKARSAAESKLKEQQSLIEKLQEESKSRLTAECKLKEQQSLIEKLQEELKNKELSNFPREFAGRKGVHEPVQEGEDSAKENEAEPTSMEVCQTVADEVDHAKPATATNTSLRNLKALLLQGNMSSPHASKGLVRKPGRASLAGVQRKRSSMATANVPPPIPAARTKTDGMDSIRSSSESMQDSFPDENLLPQLQQSAAPPVLSSPKSAGWKKGTSIAPSTVLRRSIPRKIHFKSPHLQPSYLKAPHMLPLGPAAGDREGARLPPSADRVLVARNKRDQQAEGERQGASKMRRVSIAAGWGRSAAPLALQQPQPPWNGTTTILPPATGITGVAQRVPVNNPNRTPGMYNRERAWNR